MRVGAKAPFFRLRSTKNLDSLGEDVSLTDFSGHFLVLLFYVQDFSRVCPTELRAFSEQAQAFEENDAALLAISGDSAEAHRAWIEQPQDAGGLGAIAFPLASDPTREVSQAYGVYDSHTGQPQRALFIIDPDGTIRYALVHDSAIGRSAEETLRVLRALREGGDCPAPRKGQPQHSFA